MSSLPEAGLSVSFEALRLAVIWSVLSLVDVWAEADWVAAADFSSSEESSSSQFTSSSSIGAEAMAGQLQVFNRRKITGV